MEKFWEILEKFWEILRIFENFQEILGNFATIYALSCGEKLSPKVHLWRKNEKYQVCHLSLREYQGEEEEEEGLTDNGPQDILPHLGGLWLGV